MGSIKEGLDLARQGVELASRSLQFQQETLDSLRRIEKLLEDIVENTGGPR